MFLGGIALLSFVFYLAYGMFTTPTQQALNLTPGKPIDFASTGSGLLNVFIRIILLVVMGVMGSLVANRGVLMYTHSKHVAEAESEA